MEGPVAEGATAPAELDLASGPLIEPEVAAGLAVNVGLTDDPASMAADAPPAPDLATPDAAAPDLATPAAAEPAAAEPAAAEPAAAAEPEAAPAALAERAAPFPRPRAADQGAAPGREPGPPNRIDSPPMGCTAPQLRRFIKSRAYVPMHELRRRFGIEGGDDEVTMVELAGTRVYVGLPTREGRLLGELLQAGDVGYALSMDPITPIVVGLFPMRPVPRS